MNLGAALDFEEYVTQSRRSLLRYAVVLSNDPELAQDVVQDVLLKAGEHWQRIGRLDHPHAYVRRMLTNELTSWRRKWGRVEPRPDTELDHCVPDGTDLVERRDLVLRELGRLPTQQRAAVILRYLEDLSDQQIATILGCRPATVRAHLHRALKTLRVEPTTSDLWPVR